MIRQEIMDELLQLNVEDKQHVIDELWKSLDQDDPTDIDPELEAELDRRLEEYEKNPEEGIPWEVLKKELEEKIANRNLAAKQS